MVFFLFAEAMFPKGERSSSFPAGARGHEPSGEPESLASRISTMKMGDRYQRTKPDIKKCGPMRVWVRECPPSFRGTFRSPELQRGSCWGGGGLGRSRERERDGEGRGNGPHGDTDQ